VPNFIQLFLYYEIAGLTNNPNFIYSSTDDYEKVDKFNRNNVNKANDNIYSLLDDSLYALLYYQAVVNVEQIDSYLFSRDSQGLDQLYKFESSLNSENFCNLVSNDSLTLERCLSLANGINKNGLRNSYFSFISYLNNNFMDFKRGKSNLNILNDDWVKRSFIQIDNSFYYLQEKYIQIINSDFENYYDSIKNVENLLSFINILINIVLIIFALGYIILRLQSYANTISLYDQKYKKYMRSIPLNKNV
jgi:hypothetical protein